MSSLAAHLLWLKAFHIIFVVTWFAGLFYLPRLFVYHAGATDALSIERFKIMERRLYTMMSIGMGFTLVFAILMLVAVPDYMRMGWLHAKVTLVMLLIGYHLWCRQLVKLFAQDRNPYSERWYRGFNEVPGVLLIAIVILAVVKPF
ncbi:MAG: protoporphyrinogen oxidase HemJ [Steroidobacteraceae bacterium]